MGALKIGIGGWTYEPWRGVFYPPGLPHKQELAFASQALTAIEINGTYYSTFKPENFRTWHDATPPDFTFTIKASRACTNRKVLAETGPAIERFIGQGIVELGNKLGPINWQFMATKRFDPIDFAAFLALLPRQHGGLPLRHAIEVRHESFATPAFYDLARSHGAAIVWGEGEGVPLIEEQTADFIYARLMVADETIPSGLSSKQLASYAKLMRAWSRKADVFAFFISAAKVRNPAAATALIAALNPKKGPPKANKN